MPSWDATTILLTEKVKIEPLQFKKTQKSTCLSLTRSANCAQEKFQKFI